MPWTRRFSKLAADLDVAAEGTTDPHPTDVDVAEDGVLEVHLLEGRTGEVDLFEAGAGEVALVERLGHSATVGPLRTAGVRNGRFRRAPAAPA